MRAAAVSQTKGKANTVKQMSSETQSNTVLINTVCKASYEMKKEKEHKTLTKKAVAEAVLNKRHFGARRSRVRHLHLTWTSIRTGPNHVEKM